MQTGERRPIDHFHYLTWPDFGVPTSPATFLAFLFEVRKTGVMSADVGPCVIHCRHVSLFCIKLLTANCVNRLPVCYCIRLIF